jgi:RND family efflux transporter MFP subunit
MSANSSRLGLKIVVVLLVVAAVAAGAMFSFRPVAKVTTIKAGPASKIVPGTVVVTAEKLSLIMSEAEGRLVETRLAPDFEAKEGDILAQIDPTDLNIEIKHARHERETLSKNIEIERQKRETDWKTTEEDMKLAEWQHERNAVSDVAWTRMLRTFENAKQTKAQSEVAAAQSLERADHEIETRVRRLEKMTIKAPFDGVVAETYVNKGDLINNKQALAKFITKTRLVTGKISEENFASIQLGQKATLKFLAYGDETFEATVTKKLPIAEEATQRYLIYLDVAIAPGRLLPNLTGEVAVIVGERDAPALVPRRAVIDGRFVKVVEDGRVRQREIQLGFTSLTVAEATSGLKAGDVVIVEELEKFSTGDRVRTEPVK